MVTAGLSNVSSSAQLLRKAETLKSEVLGQSHRTTSHFTKEFAARQDLQRIYKVLLLSDLQYALEKKVELELWNNAFKVHIDFLRLDLKSKKGAEKGELQARIATFIDASSGFYFELLEEFCEVNNLHLPFRPRSESVFLEEEIRALPGERPKSSLCLYVCQDCLVHLGDLARYRNDLNQAEAFYSMAASLLPGNGQPYNQLAILSTSKGDHLMAVFFYCKSILVHNPFPAAVSNLHRTFVQSCTKQNFGALMKPNCFTCQDFVSLFIQFHGSLHLMQDIGKLSLLIEKLVSSFRDLREEFGFKEIVSLIAINVFTLHNSKPKEETGGRDCMSEDELEAWSLALSMSMGIFRKTIEILIDLFESSETFDLHNPLLAGIKLFLDWLTCSSPIFLRHEVFCRYSCVLDLLTTMADKLQTLIARENFGSDIVIPLPEDLFLQGFIPIRKVHRKLDFRASVSDSLANAPSLRMERILRSVESLTQQDLKWMDPPTDVANAGLLKGSGNSKFHGRGFPWQDSAMESAVIPMNRALGSLPSGKQGSGLHTRSKSPFAETRSLFRTDSEEQGVKVMPEVPPVMTSYSLFHSGWGLQLNKEQLENESPQESLEGVSMDEIFPENVSLSDVFQVSQADSQPTETSAFVASESFSSAFTYTGHSNLNSCPSAQHSLQQSARPYKAFPGMSPTALDLQGMAQPSALLAGTQAKTLASTTPYQVGSSPAVPVGFASSQVSSLISNQSNSLYSHSPVEDNYGVTPQNSQPWGGGRLSPVGSGGAQQSAPSTITTDSIWGGGLFVNGQSSVQSIWSPVGGIGTSGMSPLRQLLQEQKKHQRPK